MDEGDEDRSRLLIAAAFAVVILLITPLVVVGGIVVLTITSVSSFAGAAEQAMCSRAGEGASSVVVAGGPVRLPVTGKFIYNSKFGNRLHPIQNVMKPHNGIDLVTQPTGGDVVAFMAGKVTSVIQGDPGAGNFVVIDHGAGLTSRYLHLASTSVSSGQGVKAGTKIGVEGTTGGSTGPHLHFEILKSGTPIDPAAYLKAAGVSLPPLKGTGDASNSGATPSITAPGDRSKKTRADRSNARPTPKVSSSPATSTGDISSNGSVGIWNAQQVSVAKEIIDRGTERGLDDWTITVAVMTAMSESSLKNLKHGDAVRNDTVGVFQEGPERGPLNKRLNPADAADIFWDYLEKVPGYRDLAPTIAAHRAQANRDPWHYEPKWDDAVRVVSAVKGNPDLVSKFAGSGGSSDCEGGQGASMTELAGAKDLPDPPGMSCPASTSPAEKGLQPVAKKGLQCGAKAFPEVKTMYGVGARPGPSDHGSGMAVDFMVDNYRSKSGRALGWRMAEWHRQNADKLGVQYVIWDQKIWNVDRAAEGWRPMPDRGSETANHLDHNHVSYQR